MQLDRLLVRHNLTQQGLADALGIPRNTVWRWVNQKATPGVDMLRKIAVFFNVSTDEVLNGPASQELVIRIVMGVRNLNANQSLDVPPNHFMIGYDDEDHLIVAGKVRVTSDQELQDAQAKIAQKLAVSWEMKKSEKAIEKKLNG